MARIALFIISVYAGFPTGIGIGTQNEERMIDFYLGTDWATHAIISTGFSPDWDYKENREEAPSLVFEFGLNWVFPVTSWDLNQDATSRINWHMGPKTVLDVARGGPDKTGAPGIVAVNMQWLNRFDLHSAFLEERNLIPFLDLGIGAGGGFAWEQNENGSGDPENSWVGFVPWTSVLGVRMEF